MDIDSADGTFELSQTPSQSISNVSQEIRRFAVAFESHRRSNVVGSNGMFIAFFAIAEEFQALCADQADDDNGNSDEYAQRYESWALEVQTWELLNRLYE